jgi:hypothetical protein
MKPNNEEIIRIAAELQGHIRRGMVDLIQSGAKLGSLHPVLECFNALDRMVQDMAEPLPCQQIRSAVLEASPDGFYWRDRAIKAEAELAERKALAQVGQTPESLPIAEEMGH